MRRTQMYIAGAAALLAASLIFPAAGRAALEQKFNAVLHAISSSTRGKPRQVSLQLRFNVSDQPIADLTPLRNIEIQLGKGFRFEGRSRPRCTASAFARSGPDVCPSGSRIGGGIGVADISPIGQPVRGRIALYNGVTAGGRPAVLALLDPDLGPVLFLVGPVQNFSAGPVGVKASLEIPRLLTVPGARDAAVTSFDVQVGRVLVAPRTCAGTWQAAGIFTYASGQVIRSDSPSRCKPTG